MSDIRKLAKELELVRPLYRRPWSLYVFSLGLYSRHESEAEGLKAADEIRRMTQGKWKTFGPIFEPDTEVYDLTYGALRKDAPEAGARRLIVL